MIFAKLFTGRGYKLHSFLPFLSFFWLYITSLCVKVVGVGVD